MLKLLTLLLLSQLGPGEKSFYIPGANMEPTLQPGDYILAIPVKSPRILDTVVFHPPANKYHGHSKLLISRIVGLGGR